MTRALEVGMEIPAIEIQLKREDLIRYAGASGDFNVIHWNERVALEVGLPGVIAHGMLTMGQAINVVTNYLGSPAEVLEYQCRFTRPVVVPDDGVGAAVIFSGKVASIDDEGHARIDLSASFDGKTVLAKAFAIVKVA